MMWHIKDFDALAAIPEPRIIGVLPSQADYLRLGDIAYDARHCFCYTVSVGPTEVWCPMTSVEGRFCPPELIGNIIHVIHTAYRAHQLHAGDNLIVPFDYTEPLPDDTFSGEGVFWIGQPVDDPLHARFHCNASPHTSVLPIRWSSPQGWPEP